MLDPRDVETARLAYRGQSYPPRPQRPTLTLSKKASVGEDRGVGTNNCPKRAEVEIPNGHDGCFRGPFWPNADESFSIVASTNTLN